MIQGQKLTKRLCDAAQPGRREDGTTREAVVFDAGDGSVKGYGLRISPKGAKSFILCTEPAGDALRRCAR